MIMNTDTIDGQRIYTFEISIEADDQHEALARLLGYVQGLQPASRGKTTMDRADINFKYIQWNRLDYMAEVMAVEVDRRCNGRDALYWREYSSVRLDRMRKRIERALENVERPDYQ